jgi:hypothetical protein
VLSFVVIASIIQARFQVFVAFYFLGIHRNGELLWHGLLKHIRNEFFELLRYLCKFNFHPINQIVIIFNVLRSQKDSASMLSRPRRLKLIGK